LKYLIIFVLLLLVWALVSWRLRPYIAMARRVLGIVREAGRAANESTSGSVASNVSNGQKLLRCATCKTWVPATRAVRLRSQTAAYCSNACLENAPTDINSRRAAGGRM